MYLQMQKRHFNGKRAQDVIKPHKESLQRLNWETKPTKHLPYLQVENKTSSLDQININVIYSAF